MHILGTLIVVAFGAFLGYQIYDLVRVIKRKKRIKANEEKKV